MAMHGADVPLWGGTAATFLAAREIWDEAARADGEGSIIAQAVLDWRPSTRTRYRSAINQLVETERQRPDLGLQEVLAESLAVRSDQGQSASGMRGIFAAVGALEDLCILPPTVLPLHRRIAGGGSQPKGQDYATPPMLRELWSAASTGQQRVVAALGVLSWVCFLRVGEAASIRPCDVKETSVVFFRSKPKQQGWHRRPLARYPAAWARWLRDYARIHDIAWDAPYVAGGARALERGLAELLAGTRWRGYAWHSFRRGGAGASWGRKPNLPFFKWWGGWTDTPTAMRSAMAFKDPEVLGPLQLPSPSSESAGNGEEEIANCIAVLGGGLFGADKLETDSGFVGPIHLPPPPGRRQTPTVEPPDADGGRGGAVSGLIDRRCTRPETPTFRRWSFPGLSLLGAGAHKTALGCGGLSRRLTRHSHRRARRPLPLLRTGDAHRHNSLGGADGLALASATLCTGPAAFPWPDASPTPFSNSEGRVCAALRPACGRLDYLHPGVARGTAVGAVRGARVRVLGLAATEAPRGRFKGRQRGHH